LVESGDVLVSTVRPNLNGVAEVPANLDGSTASTGFCVLRTVPSRLDGRYLFHWVSSPSFIRDMVRKATGASYPAVSDRIILESQLPLPTLGEQRRIADVLDRANQLRERRALAIQELDAVTEAVFWQLFQPSDSPPVTAAVGERLHAKGWRWELLTNVGRLTTGHTPDRKRPEYWDGNIPWLTLTDIRRLDGTVAQETSEHISELGERHSSAVKLPAGTVCFSRTASVGFVTMMGREMATSQDFVNWVCGPRLNPVYLLHALLRSRAYLRRISDGSTHKTIYFPTVERFQVLVPPIELQDRFTEIIAGIDSSKRQARGSAEDLDALFGSLQQRAFAGAL
jgi:type I restriction enzyme S subunit